MGKFSNAALRLTAGALIPDAGVKKFKADEGTYAFLQQMAATGVPAVSKAGRSNLRQAHLRRRNRTGATLLTPSSPHAWRRRPTAFGANLMTMYFRNPDMHDELFRPTQDGQQLANNIVLLGAGCGTAGLQESSPTR